jgi:hypothetical protein
MSFPTRIILGTLAANQAGNGATSTTLVVGTALGLNTSGTFQLLNSQNSNGSQVLSAILMETTETAVGAVTVPMLVVGVSKGSTVRFGGSDQLSTHFNVTTGRAIASNVLLYIE